MLEFRKSAIMCALILLISSPAASDDAVDTATATAPAAEWGPGDLSGCWSGTWRSDTNNHDGPITAWFTKLDEETYCVNFRGRFWKLFPFKYNIILTVIERDGDTVRMSGSSDLGLLFGTFWYDATVTDTEFVATYCSKSDHGVFTMCRCCQ